jgi:hypothetical protein
MAAKMQASISQARFLKNVSLLKEVSFVITLLVCSKTMTQVVCSHDHSRQRNNERCVDNVKNSIQKLMRETLESVTVVRHCLQQQQHQETSILQRQLQEKLLHMKNVLQYTEFHSRRKVLLGTFFFLLLLFTNRENKPEVEIGGW